MASLSVLVLSVVLTACGCGSSSKEYDENQPVAKQVNKHINGIEAGAGQMTSTRNALKDYTRSASLNMYNYLIKKPVKAII